MHGLVTQDSWGGRTARPNPRAMRSRAVWIGLAPEPRTFGVIETPAPDHGAMITAIAARADREAFARLFDHFAPRVKSYLLRLGAGPDLAEDLAQETLLSVWRKAGSYDPAKAAASTWIFTIARNLRIDRIRRERHPDQLDDPAYQSEAPELPDASTLIAERHTRVAAALAALPSEQAEVIRLSFFSDKPHSEIAGDLGLPLGTVKSRVRLAMARLRALLDELA